MSLISLIIVLYFAGLVLSCIMSVLIKLNDGEYISPTRDIIITAKVFLWPLTVVIYILLGVIWLFKHVIDVVLYGFWLFLKSIPEIIKKL